MLFPLVFSYSFSFFRLAVLILVHVVHVMRCVGMRGERAVGELASLRCRNTTETRLWPAYMKPVHRAEIRHMPGG